ncbi:unnamed protein product [Knipowitschia caucasica]|uniref:Protein kinase domain-containing protein n=1 Tax=Knipowitschia caucasica TaxID=637954 RepID=A0AAV2IY49_KNICA
MEKYSLIEIIGQGSFGRALLVYCKNTEHKYVLKEIQLPQNSRCESTRREAVLLSKMRHANIVAFREFFEDGNLLCIVMEHCSGGDLLQRIQRQQKKPFPVDNIFKWFAQMCAGAKHIHDKRVLHRDLKTKNIFLTENGTIKLGDFGSACVLNSSKAYAQTYVGTPYYVAPEIWDNQPYNNKSDVWSLGCVLYELCTLQHPFQAPSWKRLILKVCRGAYPPLPKHLPYELHYLLKHMFKTEPRDRPSLHTILTSHRVSKLLRSHLQPEAWESTGQERRGRRLQRWDPEQGEEVTRRLGEKSLVHTATSQDTEWAHSESCEAPHRKQWSPSHTVLQRLSNARLQSADTGSSSDQGRAAEEPEEPGGAQQNRRRREWSREPAQRLLRVLEEAPVHRAFSTFIIHRAGAEAEAGAEAGAGGEAGAEAGAGAGAGGEAGKGGVCQQQEDHTDGLTAEDVDEERLQQRSDDDDTDFEEEQPCDWMGELENMFAAA